MTDDYETLMRYQNEFIDYMADEGVKIIDVIDVTIIHSGNQLYCVYEYTNTTNNAREWGVYGGMNYEAEDACPIIFAYMDFVGNRYDVTKAARLELFQKWEVPVDELGMIP